MQVTAAEQYEATEAAMEALSPRTKTRHIKFRWQVGINSDGEPIVNEFDYLQAPLGMFPAQEFLTMLSRTIREVLEGKHGISIGQLFAGGGRLRAQVPSEITEESVDEVLSGDNLRLVIAILNLIELVPDLQKEVIALSLGVRRPNREEFKDRISAPPHEGGLTLEEGPDIIKVFVRQNGGSIKRFLAEQVREIGEEILEAIAEPKEDHDSTGGTPSSTSSPDIQE